MRRLAALLGMALAVPVLTVLAAAPAAAHAVLVSSDPVDGARLTGPPAQVRLTFDEPIRLVPNGIQVISDVGIRVDTGPSVAADGVTIILPLRADLPDGSYTATWEVISADTHEVAGSISFGVGRDARAGPAGLTGQENRAADVAAGLLRGAQFIGLVLAVGVALACAALWPWTLNVRRTRTLSAVGLTLLILASLGEMVLTATQDPAPAAPSRQEIVALTRIVLTALVVVFLPRLFNGSRRVAWLIATLGVALSVAIAVDGHAGVGADAALATLATAAHVSAMTVWLGGLMALCAIVLPSRHTDNLRRWSVIALTCVGVLIATGTYQAWRQIAPVQSLWATDYGQTLCVKVTAVGVMLVLAYLARRRLNPQRLRRTVPMEAAIGLAVLVVTTVLVSLPPARTTYGPAVTLEAPLDDSRHVVVDIASTRRGPTTVHVTVLDAAGRPVPSLSVTGNLSSHEAEIPSLPIDFARHENDWVSTYASTPRPGLWTLRITVRFGQTDAVVTGVEFRVW
ncbi:copper resistance CopC/CopD family protein [Mycolicibacterium sphagni]|uniref:copper resistance CopC/CopD family protein n=1 Tax=Mycolicibacterium sphagni TaxID=1786 RepID=UPI0021F2AB1F|nr:copper resistance protein CopC/CopD [Mycolicibacterium sphagni]